MPSMLTLFFLVLMFLFVLILFYCLIQSISLLRISQIGDAPFVPSETDAIQEALKLANTTQKDVLIDLGSGDGRVLQIALNDFNVKKAVGYENNLIQNFKSRIKLLFVCGNSRWNVRKKNLLKADLKEGTLVYLYLHPKIIKGSLKSKINEMPKGSRLVSYRFKIPYLDPVRIMKSKENYPLYLYSF